MKHILVFLTALISIAGFAQGDIPVKTDGTKYYLQVYDGETNEKVLAYGERAGWMYRIFTDDYFTGADEQLWSFEATEMYPGYFSVVNHYKGATFHLMSWTWYAYFADNRDPLTDMEMQYKFVQVKDDYYKLITIEKPTDGSLYGINYTPGADALNVDANGQADFADVKSDDITSENMVNMVFKFVEFDPITLFAESIERGQTMYDENLTAPKSVLYDLFYTLEKAREIRVFGTEAEMLAYQPTLDSVMGVFKSAAGLLGAIADARSFIANSSADQDVKDSYTAIIDAVEAYINSEEFSYDEVGAKLAQLTKGQEVVEAIVAAQTFEATLSGYDAGLSSGMEVFIASAKTVLANIDSSEDDYNAVIGNLSLSQELVEELVAAIDLIAATSEFEDAKAALNAVITDCITVLNTVGNGEAELNQAISDIKDAVKTFQKALEAGDTPVDLINAGFDNDLADWNVESPTPGAAYAQDRGIDNSRSITVYSGSAYQMKVYQSLSGLPSGVYSISCIAQVNVDDVIELFAESGSSTAGTALTGNVLAQHSLEIEVSDGTLEFGIRGMGSDNAIPAGNWIIFDAFEMKWKSSLPVENADFENVGSGYNNIPGWDVVASGNVSYFEAKGVDASNSITCYSGTEYSIEISQTMTGMMNGTYAVSVMTKSNQDAGFVVFGESNGESMFTSVPIGTAELVKTKAIVEVSDGSLKFGVRGAGTGNTVPNGWIVFDEVEFVRLPDIPVENADFEITSAVRNTVPGWDVVATANAVYFQPKGVGGSQGVVSYAGSEYNVEISHAISGLANGTYAASLMTTSSGESVFEVFGESDGMTVTTGVAMANPDHLKTEVIAEVSDGSLKFGIRGAGVGNTAPGGWFVMDDAVVLMKSLIPTYEMPPAAAMDEGVLDVEDELEEDFEVCIWQADQMLNIRSTEVINQYMIYSITGSLVDARPVFDTETSVSLHKGVYVVKVLTESGKTEIKKVVFI